MGDANWIRKNKTMVDFVTSSFDTGYLRKSDVMPERILYYAICFFLLIELV